MTTPNLGLTQPTDHGDNDVWGVELNNNNTLIDQHNHTAGKGVQVPSAGVLINADLAWASNAATGLKLTSFAEITAAAAAAYTDAIYVRSTDHNLYFRNASGVDVQITNGNTINLTLVGGIVGDYTAAGAQVYYDDATRTYWFQQEGAPRPWAGIRTGDIQLYEKAASIANNVTLKSPSALAASYTVTMPAALPATQKLLQMTAAGVLTPSNTLPVDTGITLSGKGTIIHANKGKAFPLRCTGATGGAFTVTPGTTGGVLSAGASGYFEIPDMLFEQTLAQVTVFATAAGAGTVFALGYVNETVTTYTAMGGTATVVTNGTATLVPPAPTQAAGLVYVLKVIADAGGAATIKKCELLYSQSQLP